MLGEWIWDQINLGFQIDAFITALWFAENLQVEIWLDISANDWASIWKRLLTATGPIEYTPHGTIWQCTAKKSILAFTKVMG